MRVVLRTVSLAFYSQYGKNLSKREQKRNKTELKEDK